MKALLLALLVGLSGCVYYLNPQCNDQIKNGDETDIDCGSTCGKCNVGDGCNVDADCDESNCRGGTCVPYDCDNGAKGEAETDVDCGGGACRPCSGGRHCAVNADCYSNMCVPGANTCFELADVSFAPADPYPSGFKTYAIVSGDLNGDSKTDIVAINEGGSNLSIFLGQGTGAFQSFAIQDNAYETGAYPTGGALADFNHDGKLDAVTADYHGDSVSVLLGVGTGALSPKTTYPTVDGGETSNLAVGDLDKDGNLDVIATNPQRTSMSVFLGRADGSLQPGNAISIGVGVNSQPYSAAIGDFDGNGTLDVAIADLVVGPMLVLLGNGDATFQPEVVYATGGVGPFIIITTDINLDGKLDLLMSNRGSDNISVFIGRGDGTFRKAIVVPTGPGTGPYSIAVTDFNLDGVPDVVTANFMTGNATVLLGLGDGHFEDPINTGPTGVFCYGVTTGDWNSDGKPDFATSNAASNNMTVKLSTSN